MTHILTPVLPKNFQWRRPQIIFFPEEPLPTKIDTIQLNIALNTNLPNKTKIQFVAQRDYYSIANCQMKIHHDIPRYIWNFSPYFKIFIHLSHGLTQKL
jgi:hypothetical protein